MLSLTAVDSAYPIAAELDSKGIAVLAKPGSLLSSLVGTTHIDYNPQVTDGGFYIDMNKMAAMTDQASATTGFSEHSARMEESADFLAKMLENYLVHARTVAAPYIDAYAKRLHAQLELIEGAPDAGVNVTVRKGNNVLLEPALMDAYERSREVQYETLDLDAMLPEMNDAQVRSLMATGSASVDAAVGEYFGSYPEGWLASAFTRVFRQGDFEVTPVERMDAYITGRENVPTALLGFLVARRLWNAPPEGTKMALARYEQVMTDIRNQCALRLCQELDRMGRDDKSGILVSAVRRINGNLEVEVNQEQYQYYLKQGGSVDALLGNQLSTHPKVLTKDILAEKDVLEAAWQRHYSINKSYFDQRRLLRMREAILVEWDQLAQESSHDEFPLSQRYVARALIQRMAEVTSVDDFDDIATLAMRLVCRARFPKTADEKILSGMQRAKKNNPGINAREAATISIMEYLYGWVGDSMAVVSANKAAVFGSQDHMHS